MFHITLPYYVSLPILLGGMIYSYYTRVQVSVWWRIVRVMCIVASVAGLIGYPLRIPALAVTASILLLLIGIISNLAKPWHAVVYMFSKTFDYRNFDEP